MSQQTLRDELDEKLLGMAKAAQTEPRKAIRLFCLECMGGSRRDAETCETKECRLWPFGMAAHAQGLRSAVGPPPTPRTPAQLEALARGRIPFAATREVTGAIVEPLQGTTHVPSPSAGEGALRGSGRPAGIPGPDPTVGDRKP